jgi:hypothetical protein
MQVRGHGVGTIPRAGAQPTRNHGDPGGGTQALVTCRATATSRAWNSLLSASVHVSLLNHSVRFITFKRIVNDVAYLASAKHATRSVAGTGLNLGTKIRPTISCVRRPPSEPVGSFRKPPAPQDPRTGLCAYGFVTVGFVTVEGGNWNVVHTE